MRIRTHLVLMAAAVVLPVTIAAGVAVAQIVRQERESALRGLSETTRAAALIVDREIQASIASLRALALSTELETGDLRAFYAQAQVLHDADRWAFLLDAKGQQLLNTSRPFDAPLLPAHPLGRERSARVLAGQDPLVTDLAAGPLGRLATVVYVPVPAGGGRKYVLAQAFATDYWKRAALRESLPPDWLVGVLDRQGLFISRSHGAEQWVGKPAAAELVAASRAAPAGLLRHRSVEGIDVYDAFTRSRVSGWTVAVAAPAEGVDAASLRALEIGLAGIALTAATALVGVAAFGRRFGGELAQARDGARALGEGRTPRLPPSRVREIAELKSALLDASGLLQHERESRAEADAAVQRSQRRLAAILQTASDAVIVTDEAQRIVLFNAAAESLFGRGGLEALGSTLEFLLEPESWQAFRRATAPDGEVLGRSLRLTGRAASGRTFPLECSISLIHDISGWGFQTVILRDVTDRERDREALLQAHRELERVTQEYQQALLEEVESRQAGIARELHDSVGSALAGIGLLLGGARAESRPDRKAMLIDKAQEQIDRTAQAVRQISRGIMPAGTDPGALQQALEQFAHDLADRGVACTVRSRGDFSGIDAGAGTHLYRIVQEAASNALRHGQATALRITLAQGGAHYRLTVTDNGAGGDVDGLPAAHPGMGIRSMQARSRAIRGSFEICRLRHGPGCQVRVCWPAPSAPGGREGGAT